MSASVLTIIKGEDRTIKVALKTENGSPYDLTGNTEITAVFKGTGGDISVTKTATEITVDNLTGGEISISLTDTNTDLLQLGTQSFEVVIDIGTERRIVQFLKCLSIIDRL